MNTLQDLLAGRIERLGPDSEPAALLPGSFNPLHAGHRALAEEASRALNLPVAYELAIANADKPTIGEEEVRRRAAQFDGDLWLTRAATFLHKSRLFPGAVFVVGSDTAERILQVRFYGPEGVEGALAEIAGHGCRFLVAPRLGKEEVLALGDLDIPAGWSHLFAPLDGFRFDLSSTSLRQNGAP